jgi:hypothetical protein
MPHFYELIAFCNFKVSWVIEFQQIESRNAKSSLKLSHQHVHFTILYNMDVIIFVNFISLSIELQDSGNSWGSEYGGMKKVPKESFNQKNRSKK